MKFIVQVPTRRLRQLLLQLLLRRVALLHLVPVLLPVLVGVSFGRSLLPHDHLLTPDSPRSPDFPHARPLASSAWPRPRWSADTRRQPSCLCDLYQQL